MKSTYRRHLNSLKTQQEIKSVLTFLNKASIYEIMKEIPYAKTTLIDNLLKLELDGRVERERYNNHKAGRPITLFKLVIE